MDQDKLARATAEMRQGIEEMLGRRVVMIPILACEHLSALGLIVSDEFGNWSWVDRRAPAGPED